MYSYIYVSFLELTGDSEIMESYVRKMLPKTLDSKSVKTNPIRKKTRRRKSKSGTRKTSKRSKKHRQSPIEPIQYVSNFDSISLSASPVEFFTCKFCSQKFEKSSTKRNHERNAHGKRWICSCGSSGQPGNRKRHQAQCQKPMIDS